LIYWYISINFFNLKTTFFEVGNDLKVFPSKAYMLGKDFFEIGNIMYNKSIKRKKEGRMAKKI